jgi:hypothetical protein
LRGADVVKAVADSGVAPQLDQVIRQLPALQQAAFALQLRDAAIAPDATRRLTLLAGIKEAL